MVRFLVNNSQLFATFILLFSEPVRAELYRPVDDNEVIQILPESSAAMLPLRLKQLAAQVEARPNDADIAAEVARVFAMESKRTRDPRLMGRAQAILRPWWDTKSPPHKILFLRAYIEQHNHDFVNAKRDVDQLLGDQPDHVNARLMAATLAQISGSYVTALDHCRKIPLRLDDDLQVTCVLWQESYLGKLASSYQDLKSKGHSFYAMSALADMARRLGYDRDAEFFLKKNLEQSPEDVATISGLTDIYIDQGKDNQAINMIGERLDMDTFVVRLAIAAKRSAHPHAKEYLTLATEGIEANIRRGLRTHLREEALYYLYLNPDPQRALITARDNWQSQREPIDLRLYLTAAVELKDKAAVFEIKKWIEERRYEDERIRRDLSLAALP